MSIKNPYATWFSIEVTYHNIACDGPFTEHFALFLPTEGKFKNIGRL